MTPTQGRGFKTASLAVLAALLCAGVAAAQPPVPPFPTNTTALQAVKTAWPVAQGAQATNAAQSTEIAVLETAVAGLSGIGAPVASATPVVVATSTAAPSTATARPSATSTPRPTAASTLSPSATPMASATSAPTGSRITWPVTPFKFGDTPEQFNTVFTLLKAAVAKTPGLPACDESDPIIHPKTHWHSLVYFTISGDTITPVCHYGHQHGMDPNAGNSIFGEVGAWLGVPGQSVSGPQQTFAVPATINDPTITVERLAAMGYPVVMENEAKHTGYKWYVSTGSDCSATDPSSEFYKRMCVTAFRVQFHAHSLLDFHVRFHSFTFEAQVCADPYDKTTCGIRRLAGQAEHSRLFTPSENVRCWGEFNKDVVPGLIDLPSDNQFYESPFTADTPPLDEFRCHWKINLQTVLDNPSGVRAVPEHMPFEWWIQTGGDTRLQIMSPNPVTGPDSTGVALRPYCQQVADLDPSKATSCRWTGQKLHLNTGYIMAVRDYNTYYFLNGKTINASDDVDGDGILDAKRWTTRFGEFRADTVCKSVSIDCLPDTWEGRMRVPHPLKRNADGTPFIGPDGKRVTLPTGYLQGVKDFRPINSDTTVTVFDGDITPPGVRSWIAEAWSPAARSISPVLPEIQEVQDFHQHSH